MVRGPSSRAWGLLLLASALCVGAILALWPARDAGEVSGAGPSPGASEAASIGIATPASRPETGGGPRTEAAADDERVLARLLGRIVGADERPIAGARVTLWAGGLGFAAALGEAAPTGTPPGSTTSAADGRFTIDGVPPRTRLHLQVTDVRSGVHAFEPASPEPGTVLDLGTLRLAPRAALRGRVVEAGGDPVAGARVRFASTERERDALRLATEGAMVADKVGPAITLCAALQTMLRGLDLPTVTTDANGRFELSGAEPGRGWLIVLRSGHVPVLAAEALVTDASAVELGTFALAAEVAWTVRVLDAHGEAVAGAQVAGGTRTGSGNDTLLCEVARSDGEGRASFWLGKDGAPRVAVRVRDADPWLVLPIEDDADHTMRLPPSFAARVRVVDSDGTPVDDATLRAMLAPRNVFMLGFELRVEGMRTRRVAPGTYELSGPPLARAFVVATTSRGASKLVPVGAGSSDVELCIAAPAELELRVVDEEERPVAGASVEIADTHWLFVSRAPVGATRRDGTLRFAVPQYEPFDLEEGVLVEVRHPLLGRATTKALAGSGPVVVRFRGRGAIHGRLLDGDGPPRQPVRLRIEPETNVRNGTWTVPVDREGRFSVSGLQRGTWNLRVERDEPAPRLDAVFGRELPRQALAGAQVAVHAGATSEVTLQLSRAARMQGVPGAFVRGTVTVRGGSVVPTRVVAGNSGATADVRGGSFDLGKLEAGRSWLTVYAGDRGHEDALWTKMLTVKAGQDQVCDITLERGRVEAWLEPGAAAPGKGLAVELRPLSPRGTQPDRVYHVDLGADGRAQPIELPAGGYQARLFGPGVSGAPGVRFELAAGQTQRVQVPRGK